MADPLWRDFARRMREKRLPPPSDTDIELLDAEGKVTGETAPFVWNREVGLDVFLVPQLATREIDKETQKDGRTMNYADHSFMIDEAIDQLVSALG